jgi:hypothetical protein
MTATTYSRGGGCPASHSAVSSPLIPTRSCAQVTVIRRADRTDIRITPGGVAGDLLMNTFGIARLVRRVLLDAPGIGS